MKNATMKTALLKMKQASRVCSTEDRNQPLTKIKSTEANGKRSSKS
jgi:hypothetical protein